MIGKSSVKNDREDLTIEIEPEDIIWGSWLALLLTIYQQCQ